MLIFGVISGLTAEKLKNAGRVSWPVFLGVTWKAGLCGFRFQ